MSITATFVAGLSFLSVLVLGISAMVYGDQGSKRKRAEDGKGEEGRDSAIRAPLQDRLDEEGHSLNDE